MSLLPVVFVILLCSVHAALQSKFYSEVQADELIYAVVKIPRYARNHEVSIWADSTILNPVALLRYDGLPTMEIYDWKADIPSLPGTLRLVDRDPTQSVLYIGVYGGVALHRYRYFAGSPSTVLVAVETKVNTCDSEYQHGDNCTFIEAIGSTISGRATSAVITFGSHSYFAVPVSSNLEGIRVGISYADIRAVLCGYDLVVGVNDTVVVSLDVYLDQRAEETNSGRRVQHLNYSSLCGAHSNDNTMVMGLTVNRPLAGVWTMEVYVGNNKTISTTDRALRTSILARRSALFTSTVESQHTTSIPKIAFSTSIRAVSIPIQITASPLSCPQGTTLNTEYYASATTATFNSSLCTAPIVSMYSVRTPMISEGFFALHGEAALLKATNNTHAPQPFVVFSSSITPQVQELAVGGGMVLQLQVKLPTTETHMSNEQVTQLMDGMHFQVAVRLGGLPQDPSEYAASGFTNRDGKSSDEWDVLSGNALLLSTRDGAVIADESVSINQADDDDDGCAEGTNNCRHSRSFMARNIAQYAAGIVSTAARAVFGYVRAVVSSRVLFGNLNPDLSTGSGAQANMHVRTYSWVITRPSLPDLYSTSLGGNGGTSLFIRISHDRTPAASAAATAVEKQRPFGLLHTPLAQRKAVSEEASTSGGGIPVHIPELLVSTSLVFEPCPRGSCVHGSCFTQQGDIAAFSCSCRYPWDGESCDTLSVSYWFYVVQIIMLVFSNTAMFPAIYCCITENLAFLVALLGLSAGSSAFYHLCDTDVYCIALLSFRSLQVLDVLFSVSAIASVLLLYAPISRSTHSAVSLLCVGLLVAPVSNLPTSPMNILQALSVAMAIVVVGWFYVSGACPRTLCGLDTSPCFQWYVRTRGDPLHSEESRWKLAHGVHDRVLSGMRGSTSSPIYRAVRSGTAAEDDATCDDDVEMTSSLHSLQPDEHQLHPRAHASTSATGGVNLHNDISAVHQSVLYMCVAALRSRKLRMPLCGLALGSTGLLCFALQGRDNYYFLHSLWHMFMMISAYLLVQGRVNLYH